MRVKENADDYRYFPDPDLPPVTIKNSKIESIKEILPTLPFEFENKWINTYNVKPEEAITLASTRYIACSDSGTIIVIVGVICTVLCIRGGG